jgi:hypothetical protein
MENRAYCVGKYYQGKLLSESDYILSDSKLNFNSNKKNIEIFDTQSDAIYFGKTQLNYRFRTRKEEQKQNEKLPSFEYLQKVFQQKKNENFKPKMILTNEYKWCVIYTPK